MTRKYKNKGTKRKRFTRKQMVDIKDAWITLQQDKDEYLKAVQLTTEWLAKETGIDDIEFIVGCDGDYCGVGTVSKSHRLVQLDEKGKVIK